MTEDEIPRRILEPTSPTAAFIEYETNGEPEKIEGDRSQVVDDSITLPTLPKSSSSADKTLKALIGQASEESRLLVEARKRVISGEKLRAPQCAL